MYSAAIDIGTNSVRLLLCKLESGKIVWKEKHLAMTRIGKDVDATKHLKQERMDDTIRALVDFKAIMGEYSVLDCPVFATSAVRDAANREAFIQAVYSATGFNVTILTGDQEAKLGFLGVSKSSKEEFEVGKVVVIDIGGGSTELILGDGHRVVAMTSLDIGAVRMTDRYQLGHELLPSQFECVRLEVRHALEQSGQFTTQESLELAFGIGGTATTLAAIDLQMNVYNAELIQGYSLSSQRVQELANHLCQMSLKDKQNLPGLAPKRADIIASGAIIMHEIMVQLGIHTLRISDNDNLEGAVLAQALTQ